MPDLNIPVGRDIVIEATNYMGTTGQDGMTFKSDEDGMLVKVVADNNAKAASADFAFNDAGQKQCTVTIGNNEHNTQAEIKAALEADNGCYRRLYEIAVTGDGSATVDVGDYVLDTAQTENFAGITTAQIQPQGEPADITSSDNNATQTYLSHTSRTGLHISTNNLILKDMSHVRRFIRANTYHSSIQMKISVGVKTNRPLVFDARWQISASSDHNFEAHVAITATLMSDGEIKV